MRLHKYGMNITASPDLISCNTLIGVCKNYRMYNKEIEIREREERGEGVC